MSSIHSGCTNTGTRDASTATDARVRGFAELKDEIGQGKSESCCRELPVGLSVGGGAPQAMC